MPIFRGKPLVSAASDAKDSVRLATKSHINLLTPTYSIDAIPLKNKDRILLAGQTFPTENGIYVWNSITNKFTRSIDADSTEDLTSGARVYVEEGAVFAKTSWLMTTPGEIHIGTTDITFTLENRIGSTDISGVFGSANKTLIVTINDAGDIENIQAVDFELDGGEF